MHEVPELRSSPATSAQHTHAALAASRDMGTWTGTPDLPNQSRAFLSMEEEIHQQWAFPVFSRRKKELDDNVPEQIFFFSPLFEIAQTCSDTQLLCLSLSSQVAGE